DSPCGRQEKLPHLSNCFFFLLKEQSALAEPGVFPVQREQLLVVTALDHLTAMEHQNLISMPHCREPVRNYETCPTEQQAIQSFLDLALRLGVDARGCFIQDQQRRILQYCPSNRYALFLSDAQADAALADRSVEAGGQPGNKLLGICRAQRLRNLFIACIKLSEKKVLADRPVEQKALLADKTGRTAERVLG